MSWAPIATGSSSVSQAAFGVIAVDHCTRQCARQAHTAALVALGQQLVGMGLVHMNGKPTWRS
jgi:hypothetical protein